MSSTKGQALHFGTLWHFIISVFIAGTLLTPQKLDARPLYSAIAIDGHTGKIVHSRNADSLRYPASLTKVMTLYLLFRELKAGRISKSTKLYVSKYAASRPPSKLGLRAGSRIRVDHAILALVTKSANDVATVIAEALAGSEKGFARRMTQTARAMGMSRTTFKNASGLPHRHQRTTARDMAKLGQRVQRDFPQYYRYFQTRSFRYGKRTYRNHNRLLGRVKGTDGIKTGYTRASGFNLISSAQRGRKKVIAVVMGGRTGRARDSHMTSIMGHAFRKVANYSPPKRKMIPIKPVPIPAVKPNPPAKKNVEAPHVDLIAEKLKPSMNEHSPTVYASVSPISLDQLPPLNEAQVKPSIKPKPQEKTAIKKGDKISTPVLSVKPKVLPDPVKNTAEPSQSSWTIQIGAFMRKDDAIRLLDKTQVTAKNILGGKPAFTSSYTKNNKIIYRARFAGFTKRTASQTCRQLKQQDIGCYTLAP